MKEIEYEVICLQEALAETKAENMKLRESILNKEIEFHSVIHENEELQNREAVSHKKVEELSKLIEETVAKKQAKENGELTVSEKDYDLLPKVVELSKVNRHGREEKLRVKLPSPQSEEPNSENLWQENNVSIGKAKHVSYAQIDTLNGELKGDESREKEDESVEVEYKMWESCKIEKKEFSPEREQDRVILEKNTKSAMEVDLCDQRSNNPDTQNSQCLVNGSSDSWNHVDGKILCAGSAAFIAPVGGVLFALEEVTRWWRSQLMWCVFFTYAIVAVVVHTALRWCNSGKCGHFGLGGFIIWDISDGQDSRGLFV
ncbi:putative chloride channel, voltage gated [Rosa chinensis]|uniref:Putative chloride channel, voltage gated n=1 Tax=Rosa chinensis TaxID=74649 RepID=A0A2P6PUX3_ROSCH|nr:putative chloride channel, voltage gated [Rosa chinensis]